MPDAASAVARAHQLLEQTGAVKSGHFLLSSGLHSGKYCQCAALFEHPRVAAEMAEILVKSLPASIEVDVVLAPALGGILWGYEMARALTAVRGTPVRSYFAERQSGEPFALRRSFVLNAGDRVLLAEDVVTTGGSVMELMPLIEAAGAKAVAFAAVADRSKGKFKPPAPLFSLVKLDFETFDPAACPLCAAGTKAVKPGSRATVPVEAKA
jgi:orotate phosphoribosyltransferase